MIQLMPLSLSTRGACSRLEPQPKFSPATRMSPGQTFFVKSGSISSIACRASSCLSDIFRYRAGIITSVSTLSPNLCTVPFAFIVCYLPFLYLFGVNDVACDSTCGGNSRTCKINFAVNMTHSADKVTVSC